MIVNPGIRRFLGSAIQRLFNSASFYAPLTHTAVPQRAAPGTTATFTRASTATFTDWEGVLRTVPSGCARFEGARMVQNLWTTSSATLANGANKSLTLATGDYTFSMGAGTGTATFSGTGGATGTLAASASGRVEVTKTITAGTFVVTASVADLVDLQVEYVTGQADQTASEYVSVGVVQRNKLLSSNQFENANWTATALTATSTTESAPDGTLTATEFSDGVSGGTEHRRFQVCTTTAEAWTASIYAKYVDRQWMLVRFTDSGSVNRYAWFDVQNGVVGTAQAGLTTSIVADVGGWYRCIVTISAAVAGAGNQIFLVATADADGSNIYAGSNKSIQWWGSQLEIGSTATEYQATGGSYLYHGSFVDGVEFFDTDRDGNPIPDATLDGYLSDASVPPDVLAYQTASNIAAAAGWIRFEYTPSGAPSGTVFLWGTYVDANNYTAILHDATNLVFRKRIAGSNYDATIANAFVSGTTYKVAATWGAAGTAIYLDGVAGTPHANTTAAQIAATMQVGADGNSLQQPGAGTTNLRIWQRQLSSPEGVAVTA